jgi:secretion/DNA translocation related TadE-like protein
VNGERGGVTIIVLALGFLITTAAVVVTTRGVAVIDRHRTQAAADLAALAGAGRVIEGSEAACAAAATISRRNGALLASCRVSGDVVDVEVRAAVRFGRLGPWTVVRRARAGPARWPP